MIHVYVLVAIKWFCFLTIWFFLVSVSWARDPHTFNLVIYHQKVNGYKKTEFEFQFFFGSKLFWSINLEVLSVSNYALFVYNQFSWFTSDSSILTKIHQSWQNKKHATSGFKKEWQFINAYIKQNQPRDSFKTCSSLKKIISNN